MAVLNYRHTCVIALFDLLILFKLQTSWLLTVANVVSGDFLCDNLPHPLLFTTGHGFVDLPQNSYYKKPGHLLLKVTLVEDHTNNWVSCQIFNQQFSVIYQ